MDIIEYAKEKAKKNPVKVAFPEAEDIKMATAISICAKEGYCVPIVLGNIDEVKKICKENSIDDSEFEYIDYHDEKLKADILSTYLKQPNIIFGEKSLTRRMEDPVYFALMMQKCGKVDVTFAGINSSTGDIIFAAQSIIGLKNNLDVISSVGIADIPGYTFPDGGHLLAVGDCAVCANPSASELASIAISTCDTIKSVTGWIPKCALLSYSTAGSAEGELVDKVRTAVELANERRPDLLIDGEFQLDAAICPEIAKKKVKRDSKVAGQANIVIFPDLNAGNIGVKLIQQFGHANAYGPLLQGFSMICCDCSRSAPVDELVGNIIFSVVRAGDLKNDKK